MQEKTITFIYYKKEYNIKTNNPMESIRKFASIINKDINKINFIYNGKLISFDNKKIDLKKNIKIFAFTSSILKNNSNDYNSYNIICPDCKQFVTFEIDNNILSIFCKNKHDFPHYSFNQYFKNLLVDESKIKCDICQNIQLLYGTKMNICSCSKKICCLCKTNHDLTHKFIEYDKRLNHCIKHLKEFQTYCKNCNKNLCPLCEKSHIGHKITFIKKKINNVNEFFNEYYSKEMNNLIDEYITELKKIESIFNKWIKHIINNVKNYSKLNEILFLSIKKGLTYETVKNIIYLNDYNKNMKNNIKEFLNSNIKNKIKYILENNEKRRKTITLLYEIKPNMQLFNQKFVENNKNNCYLIIDGKNVNLCQKYNNFKSNELLKMKLVKKKQIKNISYMFSECISLLAFIDNNYFDNTNYLDMNHMFYKCSNLRAINDISQYNTSNVTDMSYMFSDCILLKSLPDLSKWNTSNVSDMNNMFSGCKYLRALPNISNWNTSKVLNMSYMFDYLNSIKKIPDLSKWNTSNVLNMSYMFRNCFSLESLSDISKWNISNVFYLTAIFARCMSLKSLPDISMWNTLNVIKMGDVFSSCEKLKSLPDISKWKTNKVVTLTNMFADCLLLEILPDISKWNTKNLLDMGNLFGNCKSLKELPDISKWETKNVIDMHSLFRGCISLKYLPDISKWNTSNVIYMNYMFLKCKSLNKFPDLSKWNTSNVIDMTEMFCGCLSVKSYPDTSKWNTNKVEEKEDMFSKEVPFEDIMQIVEETFRMKIITNN